MHTHNTAESTFPPHFLTIEQLTPEQLRTLLDRAAAVKAGKDLGRLPDATVGMLFEKPSTRTRVSFESGIAELGGHPTFLGENEIHLGHGEPLKDTARALSEYVDAIVARLFNHEDLEEIAAYADVPVVNALTDAAHPCQTLADLLTIREIGGEDTTMAWVGDGNNVARSLVVGCAMLGIDIRVATPDDYGIGDDVLATASKYGSAPLLADSPAEAVAGADAVYTDVWVSMGEGDERTEKLPAFEGYQVTEELLEGTGAKFMHCLPAVRGEEVTDEVLEGDRSVVWQQAGNRKPVQQALLLSLLGA